MHSSFIFESAPFASCHASTLVGLDSGALLAAWFGGSREGAGDVAVWGARFERGSWSPSEVLADEPDVPCWNPVLFHERSGRVFLFYKAGASPQTWSGFYRVLGPGGWSAPSILPAGILGPVKNKPIQLASGRIVSGSSVESYRSWAAWAEISDDAGGSWRRAGPVFLRDEPHGVIQPAVFEASDGRLRMLLRSTSRVGRICMAESGDAGETWSDARPTAMPNPNSGMDAVRLADGRVVLCHNPVERGRTPLVLSVSTDDGESWRQTVVLESGPGEYSYPAVIQSADGLLHVTYTWRRERIMHVRLSSTEL